MSDFEIDILKVFYKPDENLELIRKINRPENMEARKAAIERLTKMGMLETDGNWRFKITHKGHTFLDNRPRSIDEEWDA